MIYVLNYYSRKLTYPNGDLIKFNISDEPDRSVIVIVVVVLQTHLDTVSDNDKVNETPNVTLRINSSNDSLVKKFKVI